VCKMLPHAALKRAGNLRKPAPPALGIMDMRLQLHVPQCWIVSCSGYAV
jgi:hypothetical protein